MNAKERAVVNALKRQDLTKYEWVERLYQMAENTEDLELTREVRAICEKEIRAKNENYARFYQLLFKTYLLAAPWDFHSYLIALEWNRKPQERFYQPRMKTLYVLVDALQKLADNDLDELFMSLPPRVGKTTMLMFFTTWLIGRNSENSNLYSAYSDKITTAFYNGCLEIINDPVTYNWNKIFPACRVSATNGANETLDIDRRKRYPSLTCRSLYGTLNGACDCNGILVSDDLIGGIEEAMSKERLTSAWYKVDNNLIPRAKEGAKLLWCGTRWSMVDPAGLRYDLIKNDSQFGSRRFQFINIPALDENDESNFDYDYGVGFSTAFYRQRRASFERNNDMASWFAQYMGEPVERSGMVFEPEGLRYFNGTLPQGVEPDRIFMAIDPAWGGGDFTASPVCYQYGEDIYIPDVVFNNGDKRTTQRLIVDKMLKHSVSSAEIECTKMTASYKEGVEKLLKECGARVNVVSRIAPQTIGGKAQRIFNVAPDIRERMIFLEDGKRSKEYSLFMQNVFSFKAVGKNKNDDAPDSLCMAIKMVTGRNKAKMYFVDSPW